MLQQRTLKTLTRAVGVGLHSGQRVELTLRPAAPDTGIVFRRVDLPQPVDIAVSASAVTDTRMASTISAGQAKVFTVEHLMSALAGCRVDNAVIEIDGGEMPIMDGSAAPFVCLIECAGVVAQTATRRAVQEGFNVTLVSDAHSTFSFTDEPASAIIEAQNTTLGELVPLARTTEVSFR